MNEISTAGVSIKYCVETQKGTRPTTGYLAISNVKSISSLNPEPSVLDCTDLGETEFKRSIPGLKDIGGVITLNANCTDSFMDAWSTLVSAYNTGIGSEKATWFEINVPGLSEKSFYFAGIPSPLGISEIAVDEVFSVDAYITPNKVIGWATASTTSGT